MAKKDQAGTKLRAPESMVGCGVQGQEIGKDRIVVIENDEQAAELVRSHGFEIVKD